MSEQKTLTIAQAQAIARVYARLSGLTHRMQADPFAALAVIEHADDINAAAAALGIEGLGNLPLHQWIAEASKLALQTITEYAPYVAQQVLPEIGKQAAALQQLTGELQHIGDKS